MPTQPQQGAGTWYGVVNQNGSFSILARVCSLDGSGTQVEPEEGNCVTQANVSSIECKIFLLGDDKTNTDGTELDPDPTVVVEDSVFDELQLTGWPTGIDYAGYNFRHDIDASYCSEAEQWYLVEYTFNLYEAEGTAVGGIVYLKVKVKTSRVQSGS